MDMKGFDSFWKMHRWPVLLSALILAFLPCGMECRAAEGYTYTITFYPGNHGTFSGTGGISVGGSNGPDISVGLEGQAIKVRGLKNGDIVSFDAAMEGAVSLEGDSRYYVKGIRLSGRDNNTIDTSAFRVEGDKDYVVAYGIRGDMTSYVVHYQDREGNPLADSRSYYGNVGDKPVVAFLYIEGYEPMAYNLTKTLVSNEAENVFTFVYSPVPAGGNAAPGGGNGAAGGNGGNAGNGNIGITDGGTPGDAMAGGAGMAGEENMAGNAGTADGDLAGNAGEGGNGAAGAGNGEAGTIEAGQDGNGDGTELEEQDVPLDLMELDDEDVPLAGASMGKDAYMEEEGSRMITLSIVIAVASAVLFVFFAIWLWKRAKETQRTGRRS